MIPQIEPSFGKEETIAVNNFMEQYLKNKAEKGDGK